MIISIMLQAALLRRLHFSPANKTHTDKRGCRRPFRIGSADLGWRSNFRGQGGVHLYGTALCVTIVKHSSTTAQHCITGVRYGCVSIILYIYVADHSKEVLSHIVYLHSGSFKVLHRTDSETLLIVPRYFAFWQEEQEIPKSDFGIAVNILIPNRSDVVCVLAGKTGNSKIRLSHNGEYSDSESFRDALHFGKKIGNSQI